MTAKECITGRRSIRQYTDQPVSHELLAQIVETASYAPSWKHTQIVRYIAVEGEKKAKLAACTSSFPGNGKIMENAPMVVAVTVIKGRSGFERDGSFTTARGDAWQMFDAGVASEAFCLAAYEQGLGTVIMGIFDQLSRRSTRCSQAETRNGSIILSTVILKSKSFSSSTFFWSGYELSALCGPCFYPHHKKSAVFL